MVILRGGQGGRHWRVFLRTSLRDCCKQERGTYLVGFALVAVDRFFIARSRSLRIISRKSRAVEAISSAVVPEL